MPNLLEKSTSKVVAVGEFVGIAKRLLEAQLPALWVAGEIAQLTRAASGHWYFVLRDSQAQVDCMMSARQNALVQTPPATGDAVEVFAQPSLYARRGRFQLSVRFIRFAGAGRLYQLFVERKKQWAQQGWFDAARKRNLPFLPKQIGVVSSPSGAALQDVLRTLKNRMPSTPVVIYPAPAQGAEAAKKIAAAIRTASARGECDVLIVCRGGGGIEDLWAFNEESVVRAILNSAIPVITGIGHEVDETLADYVADARAATPTAAAVLAVAERRELRRRLLNAQKRLQTSLLSLLDDYHQQLDWAARFVKTAAGGVGEKIHQARGAGMRFLLAAQKCEQRHRQRLATVQLAVPDLSTKTAAVAAAENRLTAAMLLCWQKKRNRWRTVAAQWTILHPQRTLSRGYSIVGKSDGRAVADAKMIRRGELLNIRFAKGAATATVDDVE